MATNLRRFLLSSLSLLVLSHSVYSQNAHTVVLDNATVIGLPNGNTTLYLGIPYAQTPVGSLRLRLPQSIPRYTGTLNATALGNQCIQKAVPRPSLPSDVLPAAVSYLDSIGAPVDVPQSEDCLNINVVVPVGAKPGDDVPVAVWIFGGGNEFGQSTDAGSNIVARSIELNQPVIFVSMNYRLHAFGFLGGKEVEEAGLGNLGLQDQREALRWVKKYISSFGGHPNKVTIFGESSGGESVALHLLANGGDTEDLFRAAWMDSGSISPSGSQISSLQPTFDFITRDVGCAEAADKLACLRTVDVDVLSAAANKTLSFLSFQAFNTPWVFPRPDGIFLTDDSQKLVLAGKMANIPIVLGATEDEGTLFTLSTLNLTTSSELRAYLSANYFPHASAETLNALLELYPADPAAGSPFGTGFNFSFTPEYKRLSALHGDYFVNAPNRLFARSQARAGANVWSFVSARAKIPGVGAAHVTELQDLFFGGDLTNYLVRFVATLDPNDYTNSSAIRWPAYNTTDVPEYLLLLDGATSMEVKKDTFREEAISFLADLCLAEPL